MLHTVLSIALFTVLEGMRTRLLWLVVCVLVTGLSLAEFLGEIALTESVEIKSGVLGALLRVAAVFITAVFVTTSMLREQTDKGADLVLSLPIPRAVYFAGKLCGFSTVAVALAVMVGSALFIYVPAAQVLLWTISLCCELLLISALSLMCLFTFNQAVLALSAVAAFYFLARTISAIQLMGHGPLLDPNSAQNVIAWLIDALAFVLPSLDRFTLSEWLMYHTGGIADLAHIGIQSAIYLLLLTGAGLFDLYRKNY
ncbi:MAG: ABC transporter permease [Gammaproteobacteria bacterium]